MVAIVLLQVQPWGGGNGGGGIGVCVLPYVGEGSVLRRAMLSRLV